ncbi:MAG: hypothetical protein CW338_03450 [Clostridiales bacterium]|nr:hypothetical protein [Clostridiales bacterium]
MNGNFDNRENDNKESFLKKLFTIGTPECAICFGVIGLIIAVLIILIGWGTLLVVALVAIGLFIGGVANKKGLFKDIVNRIVPKQQTTLYRKEDYRDPGLPVREGAPAAENAGGQEQKTEETAE